MKLLILIVTDFPIPKFKLMDIKSIKNEKLYNFHNFQVLHILNGLELLIMK